MRFCGSFLKFDKKQEVNPFRHMHTYGFRSESLTKGSPRANIMPKEAMCDFADRAKDGGDTA